jgi:hypothetical protein
MNIPLHAPIHLLHHGASGTLATHARLQAGFPYPTILPFAPDPMHRPVILVSRLAEHTRNLLADSRAGFLVYRANGDDVLNGQRVTLLGRFEATHDTRLAQRYIRYHPDARRYLALGDFMFFRLSLERLRYIGGFGAMGWIEAADFDVLPAVGDDEESEMIAIFADVSGEQATLLGVDRYGGDLVIQGTRQRFKFDIPAADPTQLRNSVIECAARYR